MDGTLLDLGPGYAEDCSADGNTVVGTEGDGQVAFRWTAARGLKLLGALGGNTSESHATSANGAIVVGGAGLPFVNGISEYAAFRWESGKMENLKTVLADKGVTSVSGWNLVLALGISADGSVIVGVGDDPNGVTQAYRAVVPTGAGAPSACSPGFTQVTLDVGLAAGASAGSVSSLQPSSAGSPLTVSSGDSGTACFRSDKTLTFRAAGHRLADWSGNPVVTCRTGNLGRNKCEFRLGTASQTVNATLDEAVGAP
jgi:uncharacterized membrane protein